MKQFFLFVLVLKFYIPNRNYENVGKVCFREKKRLFKSKHVCIYIYALKISIMKPNKIYWFVFTNFQNIALEKMTCYAIKANKLIYECVSNIFTLASCCVFENISR